MHPEQGSLLVVDDNENNRDMLGRRLGRCGSLKAGKLTLEHVPFEVRATIEGVLEVMAERAHTKHLDIAASIRPDVPPAVCGDPGRLRQILLNLVGNAIEFTEHGEVVVEVAKGSETSTHVQMRFAVRDTGIGIMATDQPYLFQACSQAGGATTTRTPGGAGLGLSICKQLVALMGGEIGVESTPGQGSTFWLTVPYERHTSPVPISLRPKLAFRGIRVLVVDDHPTSREAVRQYVTSWGMRSHGAASSAEALALLQEQAAAGTPYDLVLLDLSMPGTDGMALAHAIISAQAQVILMVPVGQHCDEVLRATGAAASLKKPIKRAQLYKCLDDALTRRVDGQIGARRTPLPTLSPAPLSGQWSVQTRFVTDH